MGLRYYPTFAIKPNLSGYDNLVNSKGEPYSGKYYETIEGKFFSGPNPFFGPNEPLYKAQNYYSSQGYLGNQISSPTSNNIKMTFGNEFLLDGAPYTGPYFQDPTGNYYTYPGADSGIGTPDKNVVSNYPTEATTQTPEGQVSQIPGQTPTGTVQGQVGISGQPVSGLTGTGQTGPQTQIGGQTYPIGTQPTQVLGQGSTVNAVQGQISPTGVTSTGTGAVQTQTLGQTSPLGATQTQPLGQGTTGVGGTQLPGTTGAVGTQVSQPGSAGSYANNGGIPNDQIIVGSDGKKYVLDPQNNLIPLEDVISARNQQRNRLPRLLQPIADISKDGSVSRATQISVPLQQAYGLKINPNFYGQPTSYQPKPTEADYARGYFQRYFVKKINQNGYILEISQQEYSSIEDGLVTYDVSLYQIEKTFWKLTGSLYTVRLAQYDIREGIIPTNKRLIENMEKRFVGIVPFINGEYDKFAKPTK